ncbi:MAG: hypothetical protein KJ063_02300 [Anaerolineae bacterium]|nr:hypothetical protein [Anaerolineae bacterium]
MMTENEVVVRRERRSRPPAFGEAWLFSFWSGIAAFLGVLGLVLVVQTGNGIWLAVTLGAVAFWYMLMDRKRLHDERAFTYIEEMVPPPLPSSSAENQRLVQPWIAKLSGTGQHIQMSKFNLKIAQWKVLARIFLHTGKLTRQILAQTGVFENVSDRYPEIRQEFLRLGLFDAAGQLTDTGREFWQSFLTPDPPTPVHEVAVGGGTQPTTTDDDR